MDARGVVAKERLVGFEGFGENPQVMHGFKAGVPALSRRVWMAWDRLAVDVGAASATTLGLIEAYIW